MKKLIFTPLLLLFGIAGGLIAGILIAPHKGSLTRAKLRAKLEEEMERKQDKAMHWRQQAKLAKKRGMERFSHY